MQNSPGCCGCSQRASILILLWLDLISQVLWVIRFILVAAYVMPHLDVRFIYFESALLIWSCFILVTTIHGIVGVEKQRPTYLLPYIGRHLLTMAIFALCILGALGYILIRDDDFIIVVIHSRESHEYIRLTYNWVVYAMIVNMVLFWPLVFYFVYVLCSYRKVKQNDKLLLFL